MEIWQLQITGFPKVSFCLFGFPYQNQIVGKGYPYSEGDSGLLGFLVIVSSYTVIPIKLETGFRPTSAGIPHTLLLRIGAMGFPTFGLLL